MSNETFMEITLYAESKIVFPYCCFKLKQEMGEKGFLLKEEPEAEMKTAAYCKKM